MKFNAYVVASHKVEDFEVTSKVRTNVRGHLTYVLKGITDSGKNASVLVNRTQWEKFDVPFEERSIMKKIDRRRKRNNLMKTAVGRKTPIPKSLKKVYNNDIEKWLAEHYDIDIESLDGLDDGICRK